MEYNKLLSGINDFQKANIWEIEIFKEIETKGILKTGQKGLYWFWTDLSNDDLSEFTSSESGEIDFREIINRRKSLSYSNKMVTEDGFRLVYNGIGNG